MRSENFSIPSYVLKVSRTLQDAGFEAYLVGGCVRDLFMKKTPKDWDFTTDARPEQIQEIFPDSFYENNFGTVGVKISQPTTHNPQSPTEKEFVSRKSSVVSHVVIEVTTYRTEAGYSDKRRPDEIRFAETLKEDLQRRDFTMNAIAFQIINHDPQQIEFEIQDPYEGQRDIQNKLIRAVGDPSDRFAEDALRMMRAVRFHSTLGFEIEEKTLEAIRKHSNNLIHIAKERIRIELEQLLLSNHPSEGIEMLQKTGLLKHIIPELEEGIGISQNLHHTYTVWEHNILALKTCPSKKLSVRLAALLHDVGKPRTKHGDGKYATFYNHDHVGARMTRKILERLRFPKDVIDHATLLVDQHLFYYNVDEVTEAAVRRIIARVGKENIKDLIDVRIGDRLGSGVPKAKPYRLRHFEFMVEKVSHDPISVKELCINGNDLITEIALTPGPAIGAILDVLLGEVIEDSTLNTREKLLARSRILATQDPAALRTQAKSRIKEEQRKEEEEMKKKYWVQ